MLVVFRDPEDARPGYFIELGVFGDRIETIRDFRYVDYYCPPLARKEDGSIEMLREPSEDSDER